MQISMVMSGFSAGKSDKLRKAMGKKKLDVMRGLQADWDSGAVENGYSLEVAQQIWEDAEKFAKYAFNKSHSAAYAILVMRTAYLKAHYPNEFMAAVLTSYMGSNDKLIRYIASANHNGTPVLPPDINSSSLEFTPVDGGIRFGIQGRKRIVKDHDGRILQQHPSDGHTLFLSAIIAEREANGPFTSLHDFVNRVDSSCYNRKTLEALIKSGAFDSTGYTRKQLMYFVDETSLLDDAAKRQKDKSAGQVSMFDMFADDPDAGFVEDIPEPDGVEWDKRTKLTFEKEILKMYVSDHPLSPYENYLSRTNKYSMTELNEREESIKNIKCAGMVSDVNVKRTKRNTLMATFNLEDLAGSIECICFDYEKVSSVLEEDAVVTVRGKFEVSDRANQLIGYEIEKLELTEEQQNVKPVCMELQVQSNELNALSSSRLLDILKTHPGNDPIVLFVAQTELPLTINARDHMLKADLHDLFGREIWKAS